MVTQRFFKSNVFKFWIIIFAIIASINVLFSQDEKKLSPGQTIQIKLDSLGHCLKELKSREKVNAVLTATLPENYNTEDKFPVFVFLYGNDGGTGENNSEARFFTDNKDFIAVSLPLYKKKLNPTGIDIFINQEDFKLIAENYEKAFDLLKKEIPNLSDTGWGIGGFSNGAHSIGGILKSPKLKKLFKYFILVEGGSRIDSFPSNAEGILFIGENSEYGKNGLVVNKEGKVISFPSQFLELKKKNVKFVPMLNTGHEFPEKYKLEAKEWFKEKVSQNTEDKSKKK